MAEVPDVDGAAIEASAKPSPKYDISDRLGRYLDPHLLFPILTFLETLNIYDGHSLAEAMLSLARGTNMCDYAIQAYKKVHGEDADVPAELEEAKSRVEAQWREHMAAIGPLGALLEFVDPAECTLGDDLTALLEDGRFTPEALAESYSVTPEQIDALFACAKFRYECGEYDVAAHYLEHYRALVPDSDVSTRALWGKFAADTVGMRFDEADKDRDILRGRLAGPAPELDLLQQRCWLLHWSLFVFANASSGKGKDALIDFFTSDVHMATIQMACPWLLRYVCAAVLTSTDVRKKHGIMKQLLRVLAQEAHTYRDPIIDFMEAVLVNFDFDGAQACLHACECVIVTDYFLSYLTSTHEFMDAARRMIFETYCRIHEKISLTMLASKLHMSVDEAERWVVELIRSASLDARIDLAAGYVCMSVPQVHVYGAVVSKTHDLTQRARMLAEGIDAAADAPAPTPAPTASGPVGLQPATRGGR